jgi:thiol-disulfide isomerase/thioredoxin
MKMRFLVALLVQVVPMLFLYPCHNTQCLHSSQVLLVERCSCFGSPMDRDTFRKAIEGPTPLLVSFDLPWCGRSKRLLGVLDQLPTLLAGDNKWQVELARVDAGVEVALREQYQLTEFPTVMLFRHATEPVVYFLRRWVGREPVIKLTTKEQVDEFLSPKQTRTEVPSVPTIGDIA